MALGGTADGMSVQEIRSARKLMDVLEDALVLNRGGMRYLLFQGTVGARTKDQEKALQANIQHSIMEILKLNPTGSQKYTFSDFQLLVEQFNVYLGDARILSQFLRWFPFSQSIKSLFVGSDPEIDNEKAWFDYVQWGLRAYAMALDFFYNIRTLSFEQPEHWDTAILWVNNIFDWIDISPAMNRRGSLSMISVNEVLKEVMRSGLFKAELDSNLVIETACRAVLNLFDGPAGHRRQCFELESLSSQHYRYLKFEWTTWMLAQKQINRSFAKSRVVTWGEFKNQLKVFNPGDFISGLKIRETEKSALVQTYAEWRQSIDRALPILWNPDNRLSVKRAALSDPIGFGGMSVANTIRSVTRFILRGYGEGAGTNVYTYKISQDSFVNLESDFQKIGVAVRFLDSRNGSTAKRTFKEANFLTFSGDGDDALTAQELFEVVNILLSAGHQIASQIFAQALKENCGTGQMDVAFEKPYLKEECFRKTFSDGFNKFFNSAPGLVSLRMNLAGNKILAEMDKNLFGLSRSEFSVENLVEYSEIRTMVAVLLYAEVLRVAYDTDESLKLSEKEVVLAAPRFRQFIVEQSPVGTHAAENIFLCLIFKQVKPGLNWRSAGCVKNSIFGYGEVMVPELVKVLALLKQDMVK